MNHLLSVAHRQQAATHWLAVITDGGEAVNNRPPQIAPFRRIKPKRLPRYVFITRPYGEADYEMGTERAATKRNALAFYSPVIFLVFNNANVCSVCAKVLELHSAGTKRLF